MSETIMGLLIPTIAAIFAMIFGALWSRDKKKKSVLGLAVGHSLMACGFLIFHFSPDPEAVSWTLFMHTVYVIAACAYCWAATDRVGQRINLAALLAIGAITGVMIVFTTYGYDMNNRLVATNAGYGLIFALTAQVLGRAAERTAIDRAIFWLFVVAAAQFFIRPQVAVVVSGPMSAADYRSSDFYSILILILGIFNLLMSLSLMAATVYDQWRTVKEETDVDPLSGLKMRRSFESSAMQMLDENVDRRLSVAMIVADIDHFKRVNDIWGHQAGDHAIAAFGELISGTVRGTDLCGRIGGEEFCILVYDCDLEPAARLAERLRRRFEAMEHKDLGPDIRLTASFGVAQWQAGEGYGKLFARADAALYSAKGTGRNRVCKPDQSAPVNEQSSGSEPAVPVSLAG